MYQPAYVDFRKLSRRGNLIPVYREILADLETPVSAYQKIAAASKYSFLLESVEGEEKIGRYSFLGADPTLIFKSKGRAGEIITNGKAGGSARLQKFALPDGPLPKLKQILAQYKPVLGLEVSSPLSSPRKRGSSLPSLPRFFGGAVGYLGYENVGFFEKLPQNLPDELKVPDCYFMITDTILVFDRVKHTIKVVSNAHIDDKTGPQKAYHEAIAKIDAIVKKLSRPLKIRPIEAEEAASARNKPPKFKSNFSKKGFEAAVLKAKRYIRRGDIFQVVPSQRLSTKIKADPFAVYRALRVINP